MVIAVGIQESCSGSQANVVACTRGICGGALNFKLFTAFMAHQLTATDVNNLKARAVNACTDLSLYLEKKTWL